MLKKSTWKHFKNVILATIFKKSKTFQNFRVQHQFFGTSIHMSHQHPI